MSLDITKHKNILIKILKDIYTDPSLGPILGFKGGTAAYLFYNLPRFSVDLDFDLLALEKEDFVFQQVRETLEAYGDIKKADKKRFNLFYLLSYADKAEGAQNIKVEINRRQFGSRYELQNYLGISMKVMAKEDMFAHKLAAMYERLGKTNRDIFDVWYFLKSDWPINKEIVEKRTRMPFKNFLQICVESVKKISDRHILAGMGELLDEKMKSWTKQNLKKDLLFLLQLKLKNYD